MENSEAKRPAPDDGLGAIGTFKLGIEYEGRGVREMGVSIEQSHGHPKDGKSVAPEIEIADCPQGEPLVMGRDRHPASLPRG